jgi:hypothetical protein
LNSPNAKDISKNQPEIWQANVNGQIYEANFEELTMWIAEGALLPLDKVRRGNLRWLEAVKIPSLYGFFNAKELGLAPPVLTTTNSAQSIENTQIQTENFVPSASDENSFNQNINNAQTVNFTQPQTPFTQKFESFADVESHFNNPPVNACHFHAEIKPKFVCGSCANFFCKVMSKIFWRRCANLPAVRRNV